MEQTSITKKELDVLDIVQILWERRRVVVATTLGFLVASYSLSQKILRPWWLEIPT